MLLLRGAVDMLSSRAAIQRNLNRQEERAGMIFLKAQHQTLPLGWT